MSISSQYRFVQAEEDDDDAPSKPDLSAISFGALARAQASLPPSERQLKKQRRSGTGAKEDGADSDSDGRPQNPRDAKRGAKPVVAKRSSKHAPQEQSSKRPVSRRREILPEEKKRAPARDPRFDPLSTGGSRHPDDTKTQRAYAFLDEYRDKEMAEMRAEAKKTKDPARREELKRRIMSMESRRRAQRQKDEERRLLAEHRQREKELVAQGKKPFYLKRSEQKKQLLTNKFDKMSKGQVDKAIERKRKKVAGKEKKELGSMQRVTDRHGR